MNHKKQYAGRLGGLTTALRSTHEQRVERGKLGGRSQSPTLDEIKQRAISRVPIIKEEERLPKGLNSLKGLWELKKLERGGAISG